MTPIGAPDGSFRHNIRNGFGNFLESYTQEPVVTRPEQIDTVVESEPDRNLLPILA
jgi:hypothetical protein